MEKYNDAEPIRQFDKTLDTLIHFLVPPNSSILHLKDLNFGKIDKHPNDFIIITSDLLKQSDDIHKLLIDVRSCCHDRSRLIFILNRFTSLYTSGDINNFVIAGDYEVITKGQTLFFRYLIARPRFFAIDEMSVSVVVPVRNEVKNIRAIVERIFKMGKETEIVLVEGGSTDGTAEECQKVIDQGLSKIPVKFHKQTKKGKGNAVKEGIDHSSGELIIILDGDLVIPPEELPYLYNSFREGIGELLNATRLVYPLEDGAMPFVHRLGNRFFGILYSWLLGQKLKDLFAGTKVFRKSDYQKIDALRGYFYNIDVWGDVDLLFGAAKLGLKIQDIPVHYYARLHGQSNMRPYQYAFFLCKMFYYGMKKLKPRFFTI